MIKKTAELLKNWDNILVLSHGSPDGDTLGSATGLMRILTKMGKKVAFKCVDKVPEAFEFMFDGLKMTAKTISCVVTVDIADIKLIGDVGDDYKKQIYLAIDHHASHVAFADTYWVEPTASAACEMIYDLAKELQVDIDPKMAECIYTGIATDTGCFKYSNVTAKTMRIAADLIDLGANAGEINRLIFDTKKRNVLKYESKVFSDMEFFHDDKIAFVSIKLSDMEEFKVKPENIEAIPSVVRSIEGVLIGITLKEKENGKHKVSLRTSPGINAAEICHVFGGGGHHAAAGCTVAGETLEESKKLIVEACENYLQHV